jgi:outer membrane protein assembly factor BamB
VFALDIATGNRRWSWPGGGYSNPSQTPVLAGGTLYTGGDDGIVTALNALTSARTWEQQTTGSTTFTAPLRAGSGIVCWTGDGGDNNPQIVTLDAASGKPGWMKSGSGPVIADGAVYFGRDDVAWALEAVTGALLWSTPTPDGIPLDGAPPAIAEGIMTVNGWGTKVYALDAGNGKLLWEVDGPSNPYSGSQPPLVSGGIAFVTHTGNPSLIAYHARTGPPAIWTFPLAADITCLPVVAGSLILVSTQDGILTAIDIATGKREWTYQSVGNVAVSPVIAAV